MYAERGECVIIIIIIFHLLCGARVECSVLYVSQDDCDTGLFKFGLMRRDSTGASHNA